MSEQLSAAAAAMGLPEPLVERSAAARAAETGASVEAILAEWAGGEAASVSAPPPAPAEETAPAPEVEPEVGPTPSPEIIVDVPQPVKTEYHVPAGPYKPPVLVGTKDNPMTVLAGVVGLFVIVVLVGLVGPSIPADIAGARSSELPYSEAALDGQDLYASLGCAGCHTQMVRPVIADVGLGAVSLNDSNQILGTRRFGPDLSDVGSRLSVSQLEAIIAGLGDHPGLSLSSEDLADLVAYLSESVTSAGDEEQ